jgi:acetylornithine deacetylase
MTTTWEILDRLIGLPTVSAESNLAVIDFIEGFLSTRRFETHRIADETGAKAGLFARLGPADRPGVMLSGHTDVVPVVGQAWSKEPFRLTRDGSRLYGRGTADVKGFIACMLSAADRATGMRLTQPLKLAFSWDEEVGCKGIPQMLHKLDAYIGKPSLCIVGEPTDMQIALGHKGKMTLRATCHGTNGHSAMAPNYLNAIHLAAEFIGKLRVIQADLAVAGGHDPDYGIPYPTVHVGKIAGGTALNIVPERAVVDLEIRYAATQSVEAIRATVAAAASAVVAPWRGAFPGARIEVATLSAYPGLGALPNGPEVALMKKFVPEAGLTKVSFGAEAGYYAGAGVPALVCGPGSMDQGHKPDEFIEASQLAACDAMCDRILQHLTE